MEVVLVDDDSLGDCPGGGIGRGYHRCVHRKFLLDIVPDGSVDYVSTERSLLKRAVAQVLVNTAGTAAISVGAATDTVVASGHARNGCPLFLLIVTCYYQLDDKTEANG